MPDHIHMLLPAGTDAQKLQRILVQHGRIFGTRWSTHQQPATTAKIMWRIVRYILWNPVRANLVEDPWSWPWSTLRDLGGVIVQPWTIEPIRQLARRVGVAPYAGASSADHARRIPIAAGTTESYLERERGRRVKVRFW